MGLLDLFNSFGQKKKSYALPKHIADKFDVIGSDKDVQKINQTLGRIYRMTDGRELLESLSDNQKIKISADLNEKGASGLHEAQNSIRLGRIYLSTLYHELLHEQQMQHNVSPDNSFLPEDAFLFNVMCEMDALINTETACFREKLQNNSKQLNVYKNDDKSDMGFLYQTYLAQKEKYPNLSDEKALLFSKRALSMRYFEQVKDSQQEMDKAMLAHSDWSVENIEKYLIERQSKNTSKSEVGHRTNIMKWFFAYQKQFYEGKNLAISTRPKTDRAEIFDYYKKHLNLDVNYDDLFNEFFDCNVQTKQINGNTKNILKDGNITASIEETQAGKEINFYYPNSDKVRYNRTEYSTGSFYIKEFDKESQTLIREGEIKDNKFISCVAYYESGDVYSSTSYKDGKAIYTDYYKENGDSAGRSVYDESENFCRFEEYKDGKFVKPKLMNKQTTVALLGSLLILGGVVGNWIANKKEAKPILPKIEHVANPIEQKEDVLEVPAILKKTLPTDKEYGVPTEAPVILNSTTSNNKNAQTKNLSIIQSVKNNALGG